MSKTLQDDAFATAREAMVRQQIAGRGIADPALLDALRAVPRHRFVSEQWADQAYADYPLPIGFGQTISQPYMVARMAELCRLGPAMRVLEVGAGSGYETAILARLCDHVFALEIVVELADRAAALLTELGVDNATVAHGDGSLGWPEHAPFDAIVVAAGAPGVPQPLAEQLVEGGRLVIPVGPTRGLQVLQVLQRCGDQLQTTPDTPCRFVDLQGRYGWSEGDDGA